MVLTYLAFSVVERELRLDHEVEVGAALDLETHVLEVVAGEVAGNDELVWPVNVNSGNLQRRRGVSKRWGWREERKAMSRETRGGEDSETRRYHLYRMQRIVDTECSM